MKTVALVLALLACSARADQVTLKNGDRVSGKLVKKEGGDLKFKTDLMGEVTVPWDAVTSLQTDAPVTVVLSGGKKMVGKVAVNAADKKLEVGTEAAPLGELAAIRDETTQRQVDRLEAPRLLELWEGFFDLGLSAARGNSRSNTLTTAFNASRVTRTDKVNLYFNQIQATARIGDRVASTAKAVRGGWSYKKDVHKRVFASVMNDYEYDRFQDLDLRFVIGGGFGYIAVQDARKRLDVLGGFDYNREKFVNFTRNGGEAFWGDDFSYKLKTSVELAQRFRMFHRITDPGPYRIAFDLGALTTLYRWLSWQVTASDRFLSNPVAGRQRNDVLYTTGVRVKFAR
jgi:putative salt-induced outer membrane protein YdiY